MAKRHGPRGRGKKRPESRTKAKSRSGRGARRRAGGRPSATRSGGPARNGRKPKPGDGRRDREGIVRKAEEPQASGQWLEAEDREGVVWRVQCLGEPVEVGTRIAFDVLPPEHACRGQLLRVVEPVRTAWVCRVERRSGDAGPYRLIPFGGLDAPDLLLREKDAKGAADGDRVWVVPIDSGSKGQGGRDEAASRSDRRGTRRRGERNTRSSSTRKASGLPVRVVEVLGRVGSPDADHRAVVWKYALPEKFSRRARLEAEALGERLDRATLKRRLDLRDLPFITIDPASAKDHDDAVFAEERRSAPELRVEGVEGSSPVRRRPSWARRLWVAIADVGHFVTPGSFIDAEARRRGNSFYFPDRSIPMLPERLSGDLCSLKPEVDRLALVVEMRIGSDGVVHDSLFHEAVIRSHARLAYEDAAEWLAGDGRSPAAGGDPVWGASLRCLGRIAKDFGRSREEAGALSLDLPEIEIVVDETGRPTDAKVRSRNRAHILIEEAMLAANRAVARALDRAERPTVHRVHAPPPPRKLDDLGQLFERLGIDVADELDQPGVLAEALASVRGQPSEERVHMAVLRSMSQARYEAASGGHYALRFEHYLHFTSPIRRYADLDVHRALRRLIRGEPAFMSSAEEESERLMRLGSWLSGRERVAVEAEREAAALAACALMEGRVGERFEAEMTGATEYGLFLRLASPSVSGLVPIRFMDGEWQVDETGEALFSVGSGERIVVGEVRPVRLVSVDSDRARLAFRLDEKARSSSRKRGRAAGFRPDRRVRRPT